MAGAPQRFHLVQRAGDLSGVSVQEDHDSTMRIARGGKPERCRPRGRAVERHVAAGGERGLRQSLARRVIEEAALEHGQEGDDRGIGDRGGQRELRHHGNRDALHSTSIICHTRTLRRALSLGGKSVL
ncbi:MAG: hypothetical protein FJX57_23245 [Alphaproteobacteria bacterium]|nr:hypothetical protein [Alphaproteobacteria bacterium]